MRIAIELFFETAAETAVRQQWQRLADAGVNSTMMEAGATPHVTLGGFAAAPDDWSPVAAKLHEFADQIRPFSLTFSYLGIFNTNPAVVYAGVTMSLPLFTVQRQFHEQFAEVAAMPWAYYLPDSWVPHCTLAEQVAPELVGTAVSHCQQLPLPLTTHVNRLSLTQVGTFPVRHLLTVPLGSEPQ